MIRALPWSDEFWPLLAVSGGDDLPEIVEQIQRKQATLWRCEDGDLLAHVVTRIECDKSGVELCMVLGEGAGLNRFLPVFTEWAKFNRWRFRAHVRRKGMVRMLERHGLKIDEFVMRFADGQ